MLRKFAGLQAEFVAKYGDSVSVREYYQQKKLPVEVADITSVAPLVSNMLE
jgi:hypothetical protein